MLPYLICQFSRETLSNLVKECFGSDFPDVLKKPQVDFLFHYLDDLGAASILLERDYQDKDYLEDFSSYYVKCFQNGGHRCARLHFFDARIDHTPLARMLQEGQGQDQLQRSYLGFIVVKPLPKTFIGKTCLKIYPKLYPSPSADVRLLSRKYKISLFGIELSVDTIAFQEQDKVVAACATTAIWTALQACEWKDDREIPACSEITTNAINHINRSSNSFPNDGLTHKQILRALDCEGLKHHMEKISKSSRQELFETVRCHIDSGLPLILGATIHDGEGRYKGGHAVTILGYKKKGSDLYLYVHDDRFGPFARATLSWVSHNKCQLTLHRKGPQNEWLPAQESLRPICLIIPTHKKVRISYQYPMNTCRQIVAVFERWVKHHEAFAGCSGTLTYTLRLSQISDIKKEILTKVAPPEGEGREKFMRARAEFLIQSCARFQWVGTFWFQGTRAFRVLFDATDIPQGNAVTAIFSENDEASAPILELFPIYFDPRIDGESPSFIHLVFKYLKEPDEDHYSRYLGRTYGELRAPDYIKTAEILDGDMYRNESMKGYYDGEQGEALDALFPGEKNLIWAIAADGRLLIGVEKEDRGHPTLTRFKPARIAGELKREESRWAINAKSGRYSRDYTNSEKLLKNAVHRLKSTFPNCKDLVEIVLPPARS